MHQTLSYSRRHAPLSLILQHSAEFSFGVSRKPVQKEWKHKKLTVAFHNSFLDNKFLRSMSVCLCTTKSSCTQNHTWMCFKESVDQIETLTLLSRNFNMSEGKDSSTIFFSDTKHSGQDCTPLRRLDTSSKRPSKSSRLRILLRSNKAPQTLGILEVKHSGRLCKVLIEVRFACSDILSKFGLVYDLTLPGEKLSPAGTCSV